MKKFIFMILGVSTFFLGLGGLTNQFLAKFKTEKTDSVKTFTFVREPQDFPSDGTRERISENDLKIRLPMPPNESFGETVEPDRRPSDKNLKPEAELPRIDGDKNIITIRRRAELKEKPTENETLRPRVRVFVDRENKTE